MSHRRNKLRKQVTEAKKGPWSLGERDRQGKRAWGEGRGKVWAVPQRAALGPQA